MPVRGKKQLSGVSAILDAGSNRASRHVKNMRDLERLVSRLKEDGLKIALTQGVFDLIHEGHAKYLEIAKSYGDVLIVGVDSDKLTKLRKGKNRPIVPQNERIEMLVHLRHVDVVVIREANQDIGDLIRTVKPDVLVASYSTTDFTQKMVKDYQDFCKKIVMLKPQSTSTTTARVRDITIEGAEKLASEINVLTDKFIEKIRKG